MKDLSEETIAELAKRLRSDEVSCNQFYHSFGLENRQPKKMFMEISSIGKLFPDTPIKLVIDVCQALQLYDLVELMEKPARPRTLRPALPLKEIAKLVSNRPTTLYSKVKIVFVGDGVETFDTIGNIFKKICPGSKISRAKTADIDLSQFEKRMLELIEEIERYEENGRRVDGRLRENKVKLKKHKDKIEEELLQMSGDLQAEKKKIEPDICSAFEKSWGEEIGKIFIS